MLSLASRKGRNGFKPSMLLADAGFDYRSPDLGPRHHPSRSSGKRVTLSRDYDRDAKYSQHYREEAKTDRKTACRSFDCKMTELGASLQRKSSVP